MTDFTPKSLVKAITGLFELNHYTVTGPFEIHGAEVDLVARPLSGSFATPVYIEATVEHVTVAKYGKDLTKLVLIGAKEPTSQRLIVSSKGFTTKVRERAEASGIQTLTYEELFRRFENFEPYITQNLGESPTARALQQLDDIYEEPLFHDDLGEHAATAYLAEWQANPKRREKWLVITGEYGTGKTALTRVLLRRWLQAHRQNPANPLPFRIELRDFTRQFDARGLLHHFLDRNGLGHVSVDFVYSLVRSGRILLILDGYDEMAQYLHARERRSCLEALAELSADGARGLLTSRPNYFTETEELQVFEVLYSSLKHGSYDLTREAVRILDQERQVDQLLESFIDRHERRLRDLSPEQTEALLGRLLAGDPKGHAVVQKLLRRVFRSVEGADTVSLSGKPVIIAYLVEVVEQLKHDSVEVQKLDALTEWQVYKLILDQLMLRDLVRAPDLNPDVRRRFLQKLAMLLSRKEHALGTEEDFKDLINREFRRELDRSPGESRGHLLERLFANLRASATLSRGNQGAVDGWRFSHNSLREYLVAEVLWAEISNDGTDLGRFEDVIVSDAMASFAASRTESERRVVASKLGQRWADAGFHRSRGLALCFIWEATLRLYSSNDDRHRAALKAISGNDLDLAAVNVTRVEFSSELHPAMLDGAKFSNANLTDVQFLAADLRGASFSHANLESVSFVGADVSGADFTGAYLGECDFSGATVAGTDFRGVQPSDIAIVMESVSGERMPLHLNGLDALGLLKFLGAVVSSIPAIYTIKHHRKFGIVDKILARMSEQTRRQRRGLEQRGEARSDVVFAKMFVSHLEQHGYIRASTKDTVDATETGRAMFARYAKSKELPSDIVGLLGND